jgi:hypothetical protein
LQESMSRPKNCKLQIANCKLISKRRELRGRRGFLPQS